MIGAARQWEDWIAEQAAGIVRRERAPIEAWENEGGGQPCQFDKRDLQPHTAPRDG
jgi:hypothetical protein